MKNYYLKKLSLFTVVTAFLICVLASLCLAAPTPGKVDSLKAKAGTTAVTLSWDKVNSCDAYAIFYYSPSSEKYTFIKNTKDTEYKITGLDEGETYYFAVQAYNNDDDQKIYGTVSDYVKTTTKVDEPAKVKNLDTAAVYSTKLKLTWNEVPGAKYAVYFYEPDTKKYSHISNVSKESYQVTDLDPETTYQFAVRAYKKVGKTTYYGDYSSKIKVTTNPMPIEVEEARKLFNNAIDVYMNWVYSCSYTSSSGYIYRDFYGLLCKFAPVNHPDIKSKSDLEDYLSKYFAKGIYETSFTFILKLATSFITMQRVDQATPIRVLNIILIHLRKSVIKNTDIPFTLYIIPAMKMKTTLKAIHSP
jgi:hypothetical protein